MKPINRVTPWSPADQTNPRVARHYQDIWQSALPQARLGDKYEIGRQRLFWMGVSDTPRRSAPLQSIVEGIWW